MGSGYRVQGQHDSMGSREMVHVPMHDCMGSREMVYAKSLPDLLRTSTLTKSVPDLRTSHLKSHLKSHLTSHLKTPPPPRSPSMLHVSRQAGPWSREQLEERPAHKPSPHNPPPHSQHVQGARHTTPGAHASADHGSWLVRADGRAKGRGVRGLKPLQGMVLPVCAKSAALKRPLCLQRLRQVLGCEVELEPRSPAGASSKR